MTLVPSPGPAPSPSPATRVEPRATPLPSSIPAAQPAPDDREAIRARLVAIVRDRTGYPAETLRPDLDLEADLGIDSIKRVEILGSLRDAYPILAKGLDPSAMDDLARARTLGAIVDRFTATLTPPEPESPSSVRRLVLEAVPAEIEGGPAGLAPGGVVLVTDDGRGVARALASEIEAAGHPAVVVDPAGCDFSSESAVESLVRGARDRGPIAGIVHAAPLRLGPEPGLDPSAWSGRIGSEVRALFGLARAAGRDLERSATRGGATLIAATGMGGAFGSVGGLPTGASPSLGAVVGLAKTLAREWPTVRIRAVDLDPGEPAESLADRLLAEVFADDPRSEVGLRDGARVALATRESRLPSGEGLRLEPGSPVVLTGGARGITAAIAGELARRWRPTLLVVGTSPAPEAVEEGETAEVDDPARLREILLDRARSRGESPTAAVLDASYRALARSREIRRNLLGLRSLGATVEYGRADVRDPAALARLLDGWRDRFGPPVGLVHGAGVIHDKLLRDKSPESFDRVFGTKVDGALNLLRPVDLDALRFAAFFSSIAGRFGNRGQSDYAAANETLNKLALWLDRRIQGRVVSAMWGPWSGAGMVSDLEAHLGRQGLALIPPGVGAARFADELASGRKGDVEVILSGALGSLELPPGPRPGRVATGARS